MNLEKITPVIQETLQKTLSEKKYPFGFAKYKGIGDKVASGQLRDTIDVKSKKEGNDTVIEVFMQEYGQWVQSGRLPGKKGVPIDAIEKWIKYRGLLGRDKKGRFIKRRSFAFAIQTNIKKFGIRPSNFLDDTLESLESDPRIIEALEEMTFEELLNIIEGI
jgi:hypothetical protein